MEYSEALTDKFLQQYRALERVRDEQQELYVFYQRKYPSMIESFRSVRNLLSHEEYDLSYPVAVSKKMVDDLESLLKEMGTSCYEGATRSVLSLSPSSPLQAAMDLFVEKGFSYLPILGTKKEVLGVITPNALLKTLREKGTSMLGSKIEGCMQTFSLERQAKRFLFLSRNDPFALAEKSFQEVKGNQRVGLIFVTEHGKPNESLLGVITVYDVLKQGTTSI